MPTPADTDRFHATRPEVVISVTVLLVLAAIAATIFKIQYRFNPAVIQLAGQTSEMPALQSESSAAKFAALVNFPESISPMSPAESFDARTLSDKIDGKAELYLSAGFKRLDAQRFTEYQAQERWMELYIYDMGSQENAFAVYSGQQREDAVPLDLSRHAYSTGNAIYLVHGPYYLEMIASEASASSLQILEELARRFVEDRPVQSESVAEPELFPKTGLGPESLTLIAADAFGFHRLDRVYTADYTCDSKVVTAFLSDRKTPEAALGLAQEYREFLLSLRLCSRLSHRAPISLRFWTAMKSCGPVAATWPVCMKPAIWEVPYNWRYICGNAWRKGSPE